jgi:hypothetical protein
LCRKPYAFVAEKLLNLQKKLVLMEQVPLCSLLLHWFVGMAFMLVITVAVLQLRESLHPSVLATFIHPPHDDEEMLRLLLLESNIVHAKRVFVSAAIYLGAVVLFTIAPFIIREAVASVLSASATRWNFFPSVLPLRLCYDHALSPIQIPCEVVVLHYCLLKILDSMKMTVEKSFEWFLPKLCTLCGIESFVLPIPDPNAAAITDEGETPALLPRVRPQHAMIKCTLATVLGSVAIIIVSWISLITPLLVGRTLSAVTLRIQSPHDPLAFVIGSLLMLALYGQILDLLRQWELKRDEIQTDSLASADIGDTIAAEEEEAEPSDGDDKNTRVPSKTTRMVFVSRRDCLYNIFQLIAASTFMITSGTALSRIIGLEGGLTRFANCAQGALLSAVETLDRVLEARVIEGRIGYRVMLVRSFVVICKAVCLAAWWWSVVTAALQETSHLVHTETIALVLVQSAQDLVLAVAVLALATAQLPSSDASTCVAMFGMCVNLAVLMVESQVYPREKKSFDDGRNTIGDTRTLTDDFGEVERRVQYIGVIIAFIVPLSVRLITTHRSTIVSRLTEWHRRLRDARYVIGQRLVEASRNL